MILLRSCSDSRVIDLASIASWQRGAGSCYSFYRATPRSTRKTRGETLVGVKSGWQPGLRLPFGTSSEAPAGTACPAIGQSFDRCCCSCSPHGGTSLYGHLPPVIRCADPTAGVVALPRTMVLPVFVAARDPIRVNSPEHRSEMRADWASPNCTTA